MAEREKALEDLLGRHGLTVNSSSKDVARARSKLQVQRDLDGEAASQCSGPGLTSALGLRHITAPCGAAMTCLG